MSFLAYHISDHMYSFAKKTKVVKVRTQNDKGKRKILRLRLRLKDLERPEISTNQNIIEGGIVWDCSYNFTNVHCLDYISAHNDSAGSSALTPNRWVDLCPTQGLFSFFTFVVGSL